MQNFYYSETPSQFARRDVVLLTIFFVGSLFLFPALVILDVDRPIAAAAGCLQIPIVGVMLWRRMSLARCAGLYEIASDGETLAISSPSSAMGPSGMLKLSDVRHVELRQGPERRSELRCVISTEVVTLPTIRSTRGGADFNVHEFVRYLAHHAPQAIFGESCNECFILIETPESESDDNAT